MSATKHRCAVYVRISHDRQLEREGVQNQRRVCLALAKRNGWRVVQVFEDNDIGASSRSRKPRPDYEKLLAAVRDGQLEHVVAYSTSRLTRRPRQLEDWLDLHEHRKVNVHFVNVHNDWSTSQGRAVARTLAAWDASEAETTGDRVAFANEAAAQRGQRHGGPRQFGYGTTSFSQANGREIRTHSDLATLNPTEAAAVKIAFERKLRGHSDMSIWREWNRQGLLTPRAKPWCGSSFREMLKSPALAGYVVYAGKIATDDDGKPVKATWPAIVDAETWRAVQAILSDPARKTSPGATPRHLCSGIIYCARCGATMRSSSGWATKGRKVHTYRCTRDGCGVTVQRDRVDDPVRKAVIAAFVAGEPLSVDDVDDTARRALELALEETRAAETRLGDAIADGMISKDAVRARSAAIKAEVKRLTDELRLIQQRSAKAAMLAATSAELLAALPAERPEYWGDPEHAAELVSWLHLHSLTDQGLTRTQAVDAMLAARHAEELERQFKRLSLDQQRNLVRSLLRITVLPGRGPDRVQITRL